MCRRVAPQRLQPASEINILEVGTVLSVPLGTFSGVPLPLAFHGAASLLPISKARIRGIPLAADPAGSLFVLTLFFHRFLRRLTSKKTMAHFSLLENESWWVS
jgi:hypothetical protein